MALGFRHEQVTIFGGTTRQFVNDDWQIGGGHCTDIIPQRKGLQLLKFEHQWGTWLTWLYSCLRKQGVVKKIVYGFLNDFWYHLVICYIAMESHCPVGGQPKQYALKIKQVMENDCPERKKSDGQDWLTVMALGQKHESGTDVVIWHSPLEATSSPDHPQKRERRLRRLKTGCGPWRKPGKVKAAQGSRLTQTILASYSAAASLRLRSAARARKDLITTESSCSSVE